MDVPTNISQRTAFFNSDMNPASMAESELNGHPMYLTVIHRNLLAELGEGPKVQEQARKKSGGKKNAKKGGKGKSAGRKGKSAGKKGKGKGKGKGKAGAEDNK